MMKNNQKTPLDIVQNDDGSLTVQLPIVDESKEPVEKSPSSLDESK